MTAKLSVQAVALAATLAAVLSIAGCSSRFEKATSPSSSSSSKAHASADPQKKPVQPSREPAPTPPPRSAEPPIAVTATSLPAKDEDPPKVEPPAPSDPWEGVEAEWRPYYQQFADLLKPIAKAGERSAARGLKQISEGDFGDVGHKYRAVKALGEYRIPLKKREAETALRNLVERAADTESETERYLAAVDSLLAGPETSLMLAEAYEHAIDDGADIPAETREAVAELIRKAQTQLAMRNTMFGEIAKWAKEQLVISGAIGQEMEKLRPKLLAQSVQACDLFELACSIDKLGQSVMQKHQQTKTFHGHVAALPEPHRTDVMMQLAWSSDQQQTHNSEVSRLKERHSYAAYKVPADAMAADLRRGLLALAQSRRDMIGGCFRTLDARGWQALNALDSLLTDIQAILDTTLPDFAYRIPPLIPAGSPRDVASNVLSIIPLPGSAMDDMPTIDVEEYLGAYRIVTTYPDKPHLTYADIVRPGNVLLGTLTMQDALFQTHEVKLYIRATQLAVVQGELTSSPRSFPFRGEVTPTAFSIEVPWEWSSGPPDVATLTGSLDKAGDLTGKVLRGTSEVGSFSFTRKK